MRTRKKSERGGHLIEFTLVALCFFIAFFGVVELGLLSFSQAAVRSAAMHAITVAQATNNPVNADVMNQWLDQNYPLAFNKPVVTDSEVEGTAKKGKDILLQQDSTPTSDGSPKAYQVRFKHEFLLPFVGMFLPGEAHKSAGNDKNGTSKGRYLPVKITVSYYGANSGGTSSPHWNVNISCECNGTNAELTGSCTCSDGVSTQTCGGKPPPEACKDIGAPCDKECGQCTAFWTSPQCTDGSYECHCSDPSKAPTCCGSQRDPNCGGPCSGFCSANWLSVCNGSFYVCVCSGNDTTNGLCCNKPQPTNCGNPCSGNTTTTSTTLPNSTTYQCLLGSCPPGETGNTSVCHKYVGGVDQGVSSKCVPACKSSCQVGGSTTSTTSTTTTTQANNYQCVSIPCPSGETGNDQECQQNGFAVSEYLCGYCTHNCSGGGETTTTTTSTTSTTLTTTTTTTTAPPVYTYRCEKYDCPSPSVGKFTQCIKDKDGVAFEAGQALSLCSDCSDVCETPTTTTTSTTTTTTAIIGCWGTNCPANPCDDPNRNNENPCECNCYYDIFSSACAWNCGRGSGCLHPDSLVTMKDGKTKLARDIRSKDVLINPITGEGLTVLAPVSGPEKDPMIKITLASQESIIVTQKHPFVSNNQIIMAKDIKIGDKLLKADNTYGKVTALGSELLDSKENVTNFIVSERGKDLDSWKKRMVSVNGFSTGEWTLQNQIEEAQKGKK